MRLPRVLELLADHAPELLLAQETKCEAGAFPDDGLAAVGYHAVHHSGGRWAIVARRELELRPAAAGLPSELHTGEAHWIDATVGGARVASVYVPNGRAVGTPTFEEKLAFLDAIAGRLAQLREAEQPAIVGVDFNMGPADIDA